MPALATIEKGNIERAGALLAAWRAAPPDGATMAAAQEEIASATLAATEALLAQSPRAAAASKSRQPRSDLSRSGWAGEP